MNSEAAKIIEQYRQERGSVPPYVQLLAEMRPNTLKDWVKFRNGLFEEGVIPRKYKELMVMAICFARLYPGGVGHMKAAMDLGATKEEVLEAMLLAIPGVGVPAFSTGVNALNNLMKE